MRHLTVLLFVCFCFSCNNNTETPSTETKDTLKEGTGEDKSGNVSKGKPRQTIPSDGDETNCYMEVLKRDTIVLHIKESGNDVSGKLSFDNYEKDGSTGTVNGKQEGDVLRLIYSFASEGTNSVMEVYFKKQGNNLIRGIGEMQTKGDTVYFLYPDKVTYPDNGIMKKTDCTIVPAKYR